jgi:DNA-binding NtrC family response regulator
MEFTAVVPGRGTPHGRSPQPAQARPLAGLDAYLCEPALRIRALSTERWGPGRATEIVGRSPAMLELLARLEKIARYREPVLVTGESGVGKEQLAQALYLLGQPHGGPYVSVNCPQYQEGNLTVSELFGHAKGSFTGAIADRRGAFEEAHGGVIFLDEVADLHPTAQAMLLRALATGEYRPLGATRQREVDVRVVSATNRPLNTLMIAHEFRYDLFFRLRHFHLAVPPLRERGGDWRLIAEWCLAQLAARYGEVKRFSTRSLALLESCSWPGNVRQLISVVSTGYAMADDNVIEPGDFANLIETRPEGEPVTPARLYERIAAGEADFWRDVHQPFLDRDLNRDQVRAVIREGLTVAGGSYRRLLEQLRLPASEYQKLMDFLRHHNLKPQENPR